MWDVNCGYAAEGLVDFSDPAIQHVEVLVVKNGLNLSSFALLNNNSHIEIQADEVTHSGLMLEVYIYIYIYI